MSDINFDAHEIDLGWRDRSVERASQLDEERKRVLDFDLYWRPTADETTFEIERFSMLLDATEAAFRATVECVPIDIDNVLTEANATLKVTGESVDPSIVGEHYSKDLELAFLEHDLQEINDGYDISLINVGE